MGNTDFCQLINDLSNHELKNLYLSNVSFPQKQLFMRSCQWCSNLNLRMLLWQVFSHNSCVYIKKTMTYFTLSLLFNELARC